MSELGGGQAGGFNSPYNPNLRANNANRQTIRTTGPEQQAETNKATAAPTEPVTKPELATEVLQRREDSQRIHKEVAENRSAQADSFNSREEAGNARSDRVSRFANHPFSVREQEQKQHRERLARNINNASVGLEKALEGEKPEAAQDQRLSSSAAQSKEDIDPDAKAKKEFQKKLNKILEGGTEAEKFLRYLGVKSSSSSTLTKIDIQRFINSDKCAEVLSDDVVQELVTGYYENELKATRKMSPSAMIDGDHSQRFVQDKVAADNHKERRAIAIKKTFSLYKSPTGREYVDQISLPKNKNVVLMDAPVFKNQGETQQTRPERAICAGQKVDKEDTKWPPGCLVGV